MKKKIIISVSIIACALVLSLVYAVLLFDTNSVIENFKDLANGTPQQGVDYGELVNYDYSNYSGTSRPEVQISRRFVLHNFKEGYMNISYYIEFLDDTGKVDGAWGGPAKWYIKKIDGRWQVTDIQEAP